MLQGPACPTTATFACTCTAKGSYWTCFLMRMHEQQHVHPGKDEDQGRFNSAVMHKFWSHSEDWGVQQVWQVCGIAFSSGHCHCDVSIGNEQCHAQDWLSYTSQWRGLLKQNAAACRYNTLLTEWESTAPCGRVERTQCTLAVVHNQCHTGVNKGCHICGVDSLHHPTVQSLRWSLRFANSLALHKVNSSWQASSTM